MPHTEHFCGRLMRPERTALLIVYRAFLFTEGVAISEPHMAYRALSFGSRRRDLAHLRQVSPHSQSAEQPERAHLASRVTSLYRACRPDIATSISFCDIQPCEHSP